MAVLARFGNAFLRLPLWLTSAWRRPPGRGGTGSATARHRSTKDHVSRRSSAQPVHRGADSAAAKASLLAMRDALRGLLDEHAGNRQVFRHLAAFERVFARKGLAAIERLSASDLQHALAEFESMVRNWSSTGLADLRSRMAVTLTERRSAASMWIEANSVQANPRPRGSRADKSGGDAAKARQDPMESLDVVDVDDVSLSRFEAAGGEWKHDSRPATLEA